MTDKYNIISASFTGIKCDAARCSWRDDSVRTEDYQFWLNKSCPKCGSNLLTEEDFATVNRIVSSTKKINRWCNKWFPEFLLKIVHSNKRHEFDMDGSGKIIKK